MATAACTRALSSGSMGSPKRSNRASSASDSKRIASTCTSAVRLECGAQRRQAFMQGHLGVRLRPTVAPYRAGPGGIALAARDDVDVQLAHDIAQRAQIELVAGHHRAQCTGSEVCLAPQGDLLVLAQVVDLDQAAAARHQDQPAIA